MIYAKTKILWNFSMQPDISILPRRPSVIIIIILIIIIALLEDFHRSLSDSKSAGLFWYNKTHKG